MADASDRPASGGSGGSDPAGDPVPDAVPVKLNGLDEPDAAHIIPLEAARAHLRHWWREPLAGIVAIGIACFDSWTKPHDEGFTASLDEILVVTGVVMVAGSKRLFSSGPPALTAQPAPPTKP